MITFKIGEKEINMVDNWGEVSLSQFMRIIDLDDLIGTFLFDELYYIKLLEILCNVEENGLDDMTLETLNMLVEKVKFTSEIPEWPVENYLEHNGKVYVWPKDFNKITWGEMASIKTLQQKHIDMRKSIPEAIAIILRPGKKVIVDGIEKYEAEKFDGDIEKRLQEIMTMPVFNLMGPINFFLNGNVKSS